MMFNPPPVILPHARAGRMRALAVASLKRIPAAPELPTVADAGVPGFELSTWYGVMVPAGTPTAIIQQLHGAFTAALKAPDVRERLPDEKLEIVGSTPAPIRAYAGARRSQ